MSITGSGKNQSASGKKVFLEIRIPGRQDMLGEGRRRILRALRKCVTVRG